MSLHPVGMERSARRDKETITAEISRADAVRIARLVNAGLYCDRGDFLRTAIRRHLEREHAGSNPQPDPSPRVVIGALMLSRESLESRRKSGRRLRVKVIGYLSIADDVTPDLAREAIESVTIRGLFRGPVDVKAAIADRTH